MKLLILTNNPTRASFRLRIADYLPMLQPAGMDCTVSGMPAGLIERWRLLMSAGRYDAVLIHRKCLNLWDMSVLRRSARKLLFDFDDAIMHSTSRPKSRWTSHYRLFRRTAKRMDVMIAGNDHLADYARRYCSNVFVLPTGLDTKAYQKTPPPKTDDRIRLVWIGSQSTLRYLEQLRPSLEQVGKSHKNVVLRIIADAFFELDNMPVEKCPWSLATEADDLLACDVGLAPLPDDPFARGKCGFKILQYFASGLPVVASPVGVNETFIAESGAGRLASCPNEWIAAIEMLMQSADDRRRMGQRGLAYVQAFDKSVIGERLCNILKSVL